MTTTTALPTWPTTAELNHVSRLVAEANNALDELHLVCYQLENALDGEDFRPRPTLEELGDMSRFIAWTEQDVEGMHGFLEHIRAAHHTGAIAMESTDA